MLFQFELDTQKENFYNITSQVKQAVRESGVKSGACVVYCPHTTAGITINENADPDVVRDMIFGLGRAFPDQKEFRHMEGNSTAHLKSSCVGVNKSVIVDHGTLVLGMWQAIYFCEFDGPRHRKFYVKVIEG